MQPNLAYSLVNRMSRGQAHVSSSGEVKLLCPECKHVDHTGAPTLKFNVRKGGGKCVYCEKKYSTLTLATAARVDLARMPKLRLPKEAPVEPRSVTQDWSPLHGNESYLARKARAYLYARGVTDDIIKKYQFGIATDGRLTGRIILPVYEGSALVYFQARITSNAADPGVPKYLNPCKADGCLGKSQVLPYVDFVNEGDTVLVTEGMFSAIGATEATGFPAVALLGKSMSEEQAIKLAERKPSNAYILLDPGTTGTERAQVRHALTAWGVPSVPILLMGELDPWDCYVEGHDLFGLIIAQARGTR